MGVELATEGDACVAARVAGSISSRLAPFSIVTDEHGNEIGFVTFEHVIGAILGRSRMSSRGVPTPGSERTTAASRGRRACRCLSLEDALAMPMPEVDANSVGGLVLEQIGRLPEPAERVSFPDFEIEILERDGPRIGQVRVRADAAPRCRGRFASLTTGVEPVCLKN